MSRFVNMQFLRQLPTWLCSITSWLLLVVGVALAFHVRLGLGHWPAPMMEDYATPAFKVHFLALQISFGLALYSFAPVWMLFLCARRFRVSVRFHALQSAVYAGGWLTILLICWIGPWRFMEWLAD